jgi:hypothetical protein
MQSYLRLRQICVAAPHLQAAAALIGALLGVEECHRDSSVAKYGLENVLFPVGPDRFLEVVSPTRSGTAAGRFLEQSQGRGGYMLIFDCNDPKAHAERAKALGVRLANYIDREHYQGYQLHPKDCRATFLEFNHTPGGADPRGAYWPAGVSWQQHIRRDVTRQLEGVDVVSPDPGGLAAHWSAIMGMPATAQGGRHIFKIAQQTITIVGVSGATRERLDTMSLIVRGAVGILARARQMGLETCKDAFVLCGMWIRLREETA